MEDRQGWISLYRKIREHWIWEDVNKLKWWLDILMEVNHEPKKVLIGNKLIECGRGQSIKSLQSWAKRWKVSKSSARSFLSLLEKDKMITLENLTKTTRLTVCNYDSYQSATHDKKPQKKRYENDKKTLRKRKAYTNNNVNKENNVNNVNKDLPKKNFSAGKDFDFVDKVVNAFADAHGDYTIINRGKERAAAGKLLKLYKQKYPDADSEKTIEGLRTYFKLCVNIEDNWLRQNMTLPLIVSKFNEINAVLNGKSKKSATDAGLDQLWNEIRGRMDGIS